jgi:hypothetical protein
MELDATKKWTVRCSLKTAEWMFVEYSDLGLKAIPLQAWTSPEASRRLSLPDFKTIGT